MGKKTPIRLHLKKIIDSLRQGKKTYSELKKLGIPEKSLDRALKEHLQYWGLAEKKDNYWIWHENFRVFNSEGELERAVKHSMDLLPAFEKIRNFRFNFQDPLYKAAKEHLKSYPETYQKLGKLEAIVNEKNKELIKKYSQSVIDTYYIDDPFGIIPFMLKWPASDPETAATKAKVMKDLKSFLEPYFEIYREFSGELSLLELKINMGTPLEGWCDLCPKIEIKNVGGK